MPLLSKSQISAFLAEDGVDETVNALPPLLSGKCAFHFISKNEEDFTLCGVMAFREIMQEISQSPFEIGEFCEDGARIKKGDIILSGSGEAKSVLLAERPSLNLMQQLSAVATNAYNFTRALSGTDIQILDTRKTVPGLRSLQKNAVLCGGGKNHRFGLYDLIMIKDNHIAAMGGITEALESASLHNSKNLKIEIECETIENVKEALRGKVNIIMLDNMSIPEIVEASKLIRETSRNIKIEVSGGVTLSNIASYKNLDIDYISSGSLTHSIKAVDISAKVHFLSKNT